MELLKAVDAAIAIDNLDDLFETYLDCILQFTSASSIEILLFNKHQTLAPVAMARWSGPEGARTPDIRSESWILDYSVKHTRRGIRLSPVRPVFTVPLMDSDGILGFLNIQMEKLKIINRDQLNQLYLSGLQIAAKIKELRLEKKVAYLDAELRNMALNNKEIHQYATSLSKELYAISAISAKINQSMDFDKSLRKSMAATRKVFSASIILVYMKGDDAPRMKLVAIDSDAGDAPLPKPHLKQIENKCLKDVLQSGKPLIKDRVRDFFKRVSKSEESPRYGSIIGVPLKSKDAVIGAMILLHKQPKPVNHAGIRLLSGMANIMGMGIENMALLEQSEQKKREAAFLFHSIVKFNATLNLKAILKSVAEKGVEFSGPHGRAYLLSKMKIPFIHARYVEEKGVRVIKSTHSESSASHEIEKICHSFLGQRRHKSTLIKNISYAKKISPDVKTVFRELDIHSFIMAPLVVREKKLGLLLLARGKRAGSFNSHDRSFAEALASAATLAIENARAYTASQEMSDFLEKKITEKSTQLEQIQARQLARVENRQDMVFQINRHNRFIFANKATEVFSGLPRETLCHKDFKSSDVVAEEDRAMVEEHIRNILRGEVPLVRDIEYRHLNHNGEDRIVSMTVYPEIDQNGRVLGVEGVGTDITEKKRLQKELEKAKDMAMLGEFSGAIAHQMRNPLGNILIGAKRLQHALGLENRMSSNDDPKAVEGGASPMADRGALAEILKNLSDGVYNLNQVVTELLEYTKTLKPSFSVQRIDIILGETVEIFEDMIKQNGISITKSFAPGLPAIPLDAVLIGQALQNVIHNAIQAMPSGGRMVLEAGRYPQHPDHVMISIRDTGKGVDASEIEKAFHPFYTTKAQGTGLGLSFTHRIIEAHKGMIWLCQNPCAHGLNAKNSPPYALSEGCTVHILLPMGDRPPAGSQPPRPDR